MTALVTFAQDFQHFHLVRGDRFAPLTSNPAIARGIGHRFSVSPSPLDESIHASPYHTVIMLEELTKVKLAAAHSFHRQMGSANEK